MEDKPFSDYTLKVVAAMTLVGVLYLVWKEVDLNAEKKDGFFGSDDSGASMRHAAERSDGYAAAGHVVANQRHDSVEGLGADEPPVFWNAGSYQAVRDYMTHPGSQAVNVNYNGGNTAATAWDAHANASAGTGAAAGNWNTLNEGMYGRQDEAYEGMSNRFTDASLAGAL